MPTAPRKTRDIDIIRRILDGDVNAFELIISKYQHYVFSIVKRHVPAQLVEDTAQDAFIRIYKALPGVDNQSAFKHWMTTITIRTCYDALRKQYRSRETPVSALSGAGEDKITPYEAALSAQARAAFTQNSDTTETRKLLTWALEQLHPKNRILITLLYLEGYSVKETAKLLGWSAANVKVRAFRSRQQLNNILTHLIEA